MKLQSKCRCSARSGWIAAVVLSASLGTLAAEAKSRNLAADNAAWRAECGSCHIAYPPAFLSAQAWRQTMRSLDRHFGVDASVDAKSAAEIERFLAVNAASDGGRAAEAEPRITTTRWFRREHDEVAAAVFRSPGVKTSANCAACHPGAATGNFDEHAVRIPR